jgi:prepilin-type N-terminal cleavage/methylation domain-containing protein
MFKPPTAKIKQGFSLLEVLIVTTLVLMLTGGGIAAYINFNEKQKVVTGGQELKTYLRKAQGLARVRAVPAGCDSLTGYRLRVTSGSSAVNIDAVCKGGDVNYSSYTLPEGTTVQSDLDIIFSDPRSEGQGLVTGYGQIVVIYGTDRTYTFEVTEGGEIKDGDYVKL